MIIEGTVTGVQPYGAFVSLDEHVQGLIHISEVQHGFTKNITEVLKLNDKVQVQIIDIDEYSHKISLSLRTLQAGMEVPGAFRKKYFTNRKKKIGFESLAEQRPAWIEESLESLIEK